MTSDDAVKLREAWKAKGSPPCEHTTLELERNAEGKLTGGYVCVRCGAEVFRLRPPNGFGRFVVPPI